MITCPKCKGAGRIIECDGGTLTPVDDDLAWELVGAYCTLFTPCYCSCCEEVHTYELCPMCGGEEEIAEV
jgi:hypothetical protein